MFSPVSERFAALHVMTQDETITRRQAHMSAYRAFSLRNKFPPHCLITLASLLRPRGQDAGAAIPRGVPLVNIDLILARAQAVMSLCPNHTGQNQMGETS